MLHITIPAVEQWDDNRQEFISTKEQKLQLEHSLVSLSKWESKWHKPYITKEPKSYEETIDYIRCMTITQNVDPNIYSCLTTENIDEVNRYINDPMTATRINKKRVTKRGKTRPTMGRQLTSELIYQQMISFGIPFECQKWHLNRLITLLQVCEAEGQPPSNMSRREVLSQNAALNAARRKQHKTRG